MARNLKSLKHLYFEVFLGGKQSTSQIIFSHVQGFKSSNLFQFREFLETYNRISESCFNRCIVNLHQRELTTEEKNCADVCTEKNLTLNNKVLNAFMVEQPIMNEKKAEEAALAMAKLQADETPSSVPNQ